MADDQPTGREELAELRERVRRLEFQVAQLEQGRTVATPPEAPAAENIRPTRPDSDDTVATVFTRVAMLSFVLLGALILRVLTQQHILAAGFGTLLGFVYAGHLIVLSLLPGRLGRLARETSLFQCCGVVLAFVIALESSLRAQTLGRPAAMLLMAGFAAVALAVAARHRKVSLAATALVGVLLALVALGLEAEGLGLQLSSLVLFAAAAAALSWRRAWAFLRPLTFSLFLLLVAVGLALAHKESLDRGPLLACAVAFWAVIALQHLLAFRQLGWGAAWLPLATGWLAGLAWVESQPMLAYATAGVSTLAIAVSAMAARRYPAAVAGTAGLAATAVIAGTIGWPALDPGGVLCALAGTALWVAVRRSQPSWAAGSGVILMMAAAIGGVLHLVQPAASFYPLIAGILLAAILLTIFLRAGSLTVDPSAGLAQYLAPLVLGAGLLVLFAVLREFARRLLPDPASFQLAQTGILALSAVVLTFCGRAGHRRAVLYAGLVCMILALLKVALVDLGQLSGICLLTSIVLLGISSVAVSVILRRRA